MVTAKSEVAPNVSFEARDMVIRWCPRCVKKIPGSFKGMDQNGLWRHWAWLVDSYSSEHLKFSEVDVGHGSAPTFSRISCA